MDLDPMESASADESTTASHDRATARLTTHVAITVALLATFLGVCKVKDDNIVQAMLQAKSDAVDTWGEYQAKRIKHHIVELGRDQALALRATTSAHISSIGPKTSPTRSLKRLPMSRSVRWPLKWGYLRTNAPKLNPA